MPHSRNRWPTHWDAGHNWALVLAPARATDCRADDDPGIAVPSSSVRSAAMALAQGFLDLCARLVRSYAG
jgi:hypothetical protein